MTRFVKAKIIIFATLKNEVKIAMEDKIKAKAFIPLIGITCATFIFNTSEFVPIGLLTSISKDFSINEAKAGMLISVYAWVVMLLSLPLMLMVSRINLRKLLLGVMALFAVFQVMSFLSAGYGMLMFSRIGVACAHSVFWSVVSPIAVRIAPEKYRSLALSMVVTGTSVAMIFGLPLGRMIGLWIGWRATFLSIGIFAIAALAYLWWFLPDVPSRGGFKVAQLPELLKNKVLMYMFVLTLAFATAYYTGYSYIEPFLSQVAGMHNDLITATLMFFGAAGILGSALFSKFYDANRKRFSDLSLIALALCLLLLYPFSFNKVLVVILCIVWGVAVTGYNVAMQSEIINHATARSTAVAMSIFSGIFNLGIGSGALIGGTVCSRLSVSYIGFAGGLLALATLALWFTKMRRQL